MIQGDGSEAEGEDDVDDDEEAGDEGETFEEEGEVQAHLVLGLVQLSVCIFHTGVFHLHVQGGGEGGGPEQVCSPHFTVLVHRLCCIWTSTQGMTSHCMSNLSQPLFMHDTPFAVLSVSHYKLASPPAHT